MAIEWLDDAQDNKIEWLDDKPTSSKQKVVNKPKESNWYDPDRLAANPLTRFATAAAAPMLGAFELIPGDVGQYWSQKNKAMTELVKSGIENQSDLASGVGNVSELGGMLLSPASLGLAKVMPAAKTTMDLVRQGAIVGTAAGLTTPTGEYGDLGAKSHVLNAGLGGLTGAIATPIVGKIISGAGNIISPFLSEKAVDSGAGKLAVKASGTRAQDVANQLKYGDITGSAAKTALPAKSSEFSAVMDIVKGNRGSEYGDLSRAEELARLDKLKAISPNLAESEAKRFDLSNKYYEKASKAIVDIDNKLSTLFNRMPQGTIDAARRIANIEDRPFIMDDKITGESLHYIKRALSDIANSPDPTKGIGRDEQAAVRKLLSDYITTFEEKVPAYGTARKLYAKLSEPVNQAKVIKEMGSILEKPGGGERVSAFLNALGRGEQALLKKSTGFARYEADDLKKVLTPEQLAVVDSIASDLNANIELSSRETEGMKAALKAIRASENKEIRGPNLVNYKVSLINKILNALEGAGGEKIETRLADLGLPGNQRKLAELMQSRIDKPQGMLGDVVKFQGGAIQDILDSRKYSQIYNPLSYSLFPNTEERAQQ